MREGWAAVLAAAKREQCSRRPLSWEDLSAFMELFFKGMEYAVENSDALRTTEAIMFVTHNLGDPVLLINHHSRHLHLSSLSPTAPELRLQLVTMRSAKWSPSLQ